MSNKKANKRAEQLGKTDNVWTTTSPNPDRQSWADMTEEESKTSPVVETVEVKEDPIIKMKKEVISQFKMNFEERSDMFLGLSEACKGVHDDLSVLESFFNGEKYTLDSLNNNDELKVRMKQCEDITRNIESQRQQLRDSVGTIYETLFELVNSMSKLVSASKLYSEFIKRKMKAEEEARQEASSAATVENRGKMDKPKRSIYTSTVKLSDSTMTRTNELLNDIYKTKSVEIPHSDSLWTYLGRESIPDAVKPVKKDVKETKVVVDKEGKEFPSLATPAWKQAVTQLARALPKENDEIKLVPIKVNFYAGENSTVDPKYIYTKYEIFVPGYHFPTLENAMEFVEYERPVGKYITCNDRPGMIGYVIESDDFTNTPSIFMMRNKFSALMGFLRTKFCPFGVNCNKQKCHDYHEHNEDEAFCYSPSISKDPMLRLGDDHVYYDDGQEIEEKLSKKHVNPEALKVIHNISPMTCSIKNFKMATKCDRDTEKAMRLVKGFGLFNSNKENKGSNLFCIKCVV
jgi:hypothetical protein